MKSRPQYLVSAALIAGLALFAFNTNADALTSKFAETLVTLRDSVDRLTKELEDKKAEQRAELRALNAQKSDLEIQVQREQAQAKALRAAIERRQSEVDSAKNNAETLSPMLFKSIAQIRKSVDEGLPFKKAERQTTDRVARGRSTRRGRTSRHGRDVLSNRRRDRGACGPRRRRLDV